jgi:hypothetical protein
MTLQEPISPLPAPSQPDAHAQPAQVSGTVSERQHAAPPAPIPAAEPVQPPSVAPELLPYNAPPPAAPVPRPEANPAPSGMVPPPSGGRESGVKERIQGDHTASSQIPIDPSQHYLPEKPLPNVDPIHVPGMP